MSDEKTVDQLNLSEIEIRSDLRMTKASNITDGEMAAADVKNLLQIVSPELAKKAAAQVSDNMQEYPGYAKLMSENHTDVIDRIKSLTPNTDMKTLLKNSIDLRGFEDLEKKRAAEFNEVRDALNELNTIERVVETTVKPDVKGQANTNTNPSGNEVESDEIFTASASTTKIATVIPADVEKRFVRVGNKYYYAANTEAIAFEDKGNSLTTKSNGEGMAASLVAIANARGWDEIKVSGSETFKREVWLEAAAKGMHVKGYKPNEFDLAALEKRVPEGKVEKVTENFRGREKDESEKNKPQESDAAIDPNKKLAKVFELNTPVDAARKHPELAGAAALTTAVFERHSSNLNEDEKRVVLDQVKKNVVKNIANGKIPDIQVAEKNQSETRNQLNENEKDLSI